MENLITAAMNCVVFVIAIFAITGLLTGFLYFIFEVLRSMLWRK
jgi:hypothetical protein